MIRSLMMDSIILPIVCGVAISGGLSNGSIVYSFANESEKTFAMS